MVTDLSETDGYSCEVAAKNPTGEFHQRLASKAVSQLAKQAHAANKGVKLN
jgi:hypothetical protein